MKHKDYWKARFLQIEATSNQDSLEYYNQVQNQFDKALRTNEATLRAWYQRLADNNGVSMHEARKMLTANELAEFKWNVKEYIEYGQLNGLDGKWEKELENASAKFHISRFEALKVNMQQSLEVAYGNLLDGTDKLIRKAYTEGYYHSIFEIQKGFNIGFDIASIDNNKLSKIISKPWVPDGKNFSERIWGNKNKLINELHTELTQMCILGKAPDKAIKNIAKKMNTSKHNAGKLVMTESAFFSSVAQKDCFNNLDVEKYEIVATLDSLTSITCQELDGRVFDMKDYIAGSTAPPFHVWCRSCTVPWFDDDFTIGQRAARDEDGKTYYVPGDMKYKDWKKTFVDGGSKDDRNPFDVNEESTKALKTPELESADRGKFIPVTDGAINKVSKVKIESFTDEQNSIIQAEHKKILVQAKQENASNEISYIFSSDLSTKTIQKGGRSELEFLGEAKKMLVSEKDLFVMHNHPSNSSFSMTDLKFFIANKSIKSLSVVRNNGVVEVLTKNIDYDSIKATTEIRRLYKKVGKTGDSLSFDKVINMFMTKYKGVTYDK